MLCTGLTGNVPCQSYGAESQSDIKGLKHLMDGKWPVWFTGLFLLSDLNVIHHGIECETNGPFDDC